MLDQILEHKKREVKERKKAYYLADLKARIRDLPRPLGFHQTLARAPAGTDIQGSISPSGRGTPRLIAEVKKASPSKGVLRDPCDPVDVARTYRRYGASALSVLTDVAFFRGSLDDLKKVREAVPLPALDKEFMVDELQFFEARAYLADAVLLIVAALDRVQLVDYYDLARQELGLDVLIEVHHERELEVALERLPHARLFGINNRDLNSFVTSLDVTERLAKHVPDDKLVVSESGIATRDDVKRVAEAGARAILVGESLLTAPDIGAKIKELLGR